MGEALTNHAVPTAHMLYTGIHACHLNGLRPGRQPHQLKGLLFMGQAPSALGTWVQSWSGSLNDFGSHPLCSWTHDILQRL